MVTEAQKKAAARYQRENCINKTFRFNKNNDRDVAILAHLNSQENQSDYVKTLIERDM